MHTFKIFRRSDKSIVHTFRCEDYSEFRRYWLNQPAPQDFDYREIDPTPQAPYVFHVIKTHDGEYRTFKGQPERIPLTDELCATISKFNGYCSPGEVHTALMRGQAIYTNFSRYVLE